MTGMPSRHTGTIAALLITAALFLAMPGLMKQEGDHNRMAESLRPARLRTLTVWLLPDGPEDRKLLGEICAAFEKQHKGARVFLRRVTADELYAQDGVLPDVVLFATGEISRPEEVLRPLAAEHPHPSAQYAAVTYAVPLWYAPELLCYPKAWGDDPWTMLARPGMLKLPSGTALQRLMLTCPQAQRQMMIDAALGRIQPTPVPQPARDSVPPKRGRTPTPAPTDAGQAHIAAKPAEDEMAIALTPETSSCVRYAALCRDGEDARVFLEMLVNADTADFRRADASVILPNAFASTAEEIRQLCLDGFSRSDDPALTLLRLR